VATSEKNFDPIVLPGIRKGGGGGSMQEGGRAIVSAGRKSGIHVVHRRGKEEYWVRLVGQERGYIQRETFSLRSCSFKPSRGSPPLKT